MLARMAGFNEEGEKLARKFIDSFKEFVNETCRRERCNSRNIGPDSSEDGYERDLLGLMKELFVVNPAFTRRPMTWSSGHQKETEQYVESFKLDWLDDKEVNPVIPGTNEDLVDDVFETSGNFVECEINVNEFPAWKSTPFLNKTGKKDVQPRPIEDGIRTAESELDVIGDLSYKNLTESADSGVFMDMSAYLNQMSEAECDTWKDKTMLNAGEQSRQRDLNRGSPHSESGDSTAGQSSHNRSKIPVLAKSGNSGLKKEKREGENWMRSLRESILKFKDFDFGMGTVYPEKKKQVNDRSKSIDSHSTQALTEGKAKHSRLKPALSMMSLSYYSPRYGSTSLWEDRASLEKNYSKYIEDEKQVLKDVKCDIEYEEANDFANRSLRGSDKCEKSRSAFDVSLSRDDSIYGATGYQMRNASEYDSSSIRKKQKSLKRGTTFGSFGERPIQSKDTFKTSRIPVFIGNL